MCYLDFSKIEITEKLVFDLFKNKKSNLNNNYKKLLYSKDFLPILNYLKNTFPDLTPEESVINLIKKYKKEIKEKHKLFRNINFDTIEIDDDFIISIFSKNGNLGNWYNKLLNRTDNKKLIEYLKTRFDDSDSLHETLHRIIHHIEIKPICPICGGPIIFKNIGNFYNKTCSIECAKKLVEKTCLEKYGGTRPLKNKKVREKLSNSLKTKEVQEKISSTKRKNKSFNVSRIEEQVYQWLIEEFSSENIIRQYKEERYPWHCDFYIKSPDLFIEINGNWTHGSHPFDGNNPEDLERLNKLKNRLTRSKYYKNAINVWTILDVKKRNHANLNKLNFIEIFGCNFTKDFLFDQISKI